MMATEEKLLKALEYFKHTNNAEFPCDTGQRNKEKIQNCLYISDTISSSTIRVLPSFHQLLSTAFDTLLQLCNDNESDIRLIAEESLNKIIKAMDNENTNKVLIELHKEIKKNGAARSLKAALWRFSCLADLIRLPKRKQYLVNLIPCIVNVAERNEELLHEILMNSLPKILKSLGNFVSDSDVRVLLNIFLKNISNSSTIIRRTAANCLLIVCTNCRKPYIFLLFLLDTLLDLLTAVGNSTTTFLVLGVLNSLKLLIPYIKNIENRQEIQGSFGITKKMDEIKVGADKFIQVYEICLHFLLCTNESVTSAALDTLNSLLQNCTPEIKTILQSPDGICNNRLSLPIYLHTTANYQGDQSIMSSLRLDIDEQNQLEESHASIVTYEVAEELIRNLEYKTGADSKKEELCDVNNVIMVRNSADICDENVNIGAFTDKEISLSYCTRLICKLFLLTGRRSCTISDIDTRISVKSLALTCLSSLIAIHPKGFLLYLDKDYSESNNRTDGASKQPVCDILLLGDHLDPQLRGVVRIFAASFIKAVLMESCGCRYESWFADRNIEYEVFRLEHLLHFMVKGLQDESSNCVRQTLTGLNICLKSILNSPNYSSGMPVLEILSSIVKNTHWLVKTKLLDVVTELPFLTIHSITGNYEFQNQIVLNVLFGLLVDEDQRVRNAASNAIVNIIPSVHFEQQKTVQEVAIERNFMYFHNLNLAGDETRKLFMDGVPFPFSALNETRDDHIESTLSRIVSKLHKLLLRNSANGVIHGYVETLSLLSMCYPSTLYKTSWNSFKAYELSYDRASTTKNNSSITASLNKHSSNMIGSNELLKIIHCFLQHEFIYDINCHVHVLQLHANLLSGICIENLQFVDLSSATQKPLWCMFGNDKQLQQICESFLNHIVRMLNIFVHIIDDVPPIEVKPIVQNVAGSLGTVSPLKSKKVEMEKNAEKKATENDEKPERKNESVKTGMGHFSNSVHYMKIHDILKISYAKYKVSLNYDGTTENIIEFITTVLKSLGQMLEIATIVESSRIAEEILSYLQTIFYLEPTCTVTCVHQLLKSLFGTNLVLNMDLLQQPVQHENQDVIKDDGLSYILSQRCYNDMYHYMSLFKQKNKFNKNANSLTIGYIHRKERKHIPIKSDKVLANYIRLFEPMVIQSLKHYTITSNVDLQCSVLHLLNQLVQLKVNYCLLDSEQVFIKFIQKQFEFIEEGLITHPEKLIPKIFYFLMNLSHGKQHSKSIISVPKVIQLCDGLMACGQAPLTYCIPALKPIVEDLFLVRNKANTVDFNELETAREVLLSMLFRLFEYSDVMELVVILNKSKHCDNVEKWSKWSKQIFDVFLMKLAHNKLRLDSAPNMLSLLTLLISLNTAVFRSADDLLIILFQKFPVKVDNITVFSRWLGKIIIILTIVLHLKEDVLLANINESLKDFSPESIFDNVSVTTDPLNVTNVVSCFEGLPPDVILVKFIFRALDLASFKCALAVNDVENCFLIDQLSHFLFICSYLYQSGNHATITNTTIKLLNSDNQSKHNISLDDVNRNFLKISHFFPTITYQWCSLLGGLNYTSRKFWSGIMGIGSQQDARNSKTNNVCVNTEISTTAAALAFTEYLIENGKDIEHLRWFVKNKKNLLIQICTEPAVSELISTIHENPHEITFIEAIADECSCDSLEPAFVIKVLDVLHNCHKNQTGALIRVLVKNLLHSRHLALLRMVVNLTCRKLEYLLTLKVDDIKNQLPEDKLLDIKKHVGNKALIKKNESLVGLFNKLSSQVYNCSASEISQPKSTSLAHIKNLEIDSKWYLMQLQCKDYFRGECPEVVAVILAKLDPGDFELLLSNDHSKKLLLENALSCAEYNSENCSENDVIILDLCLESVFVYIVDFLSLLPKHHQVFLPLEGRETQPEQRYSQQLLQSFKSEEFWKKFHDLIPIVTKYAIFYKRFPQLDDSLKANNLSLILRVCVTCLESVNYLISCGNFNFNMDSIENCLTCVDAILKVPDLTNVLSLDVHLTWLCSCINSLYKFVVFLVASYEIHPALEVNLPNSVAYGREITMAKYACLQLNIVFTTVTEKCRSLAVNVPSSIYESVKSITVSLAKLPLVNSYLLTPTKALKHDDLALEWTGPFKTKVPPLPVDFLKDVDVIDDFIFRISHLGWSSRQQFEETWMSLLSILNSSLIEENDVEHITSFAIRAITALLAQTLYEAAPGNANNPKFFHVPRDAAISELDSSIKKLKTVQDKFEKKFLIEADFLTDPNVIMNVFGKPNVEKCSTSFSSGQFSIAYLLFSSESIESFDVNSSLTKIFNNREKVLEQSGLDLNSCVQSLLDLYSQWIKIDGAQSLKIFNEIFRSILIISDLFREKSHFMWMLDTCIELSRNQLLENEFFYQYLTVCISKAAAIIHPNIETYELIKKILIQNIKSQYLSMRISCLHALLYLLEGCVLANTIIGGVSEELQLLLPIATEYINSIAEINITVSGQSQEHNMLVWAVKFFIIENIPDDYLPVGFTNSVIHAVITHLRKKKQQTNIYSSLVKALERLIIRRCLSSNLCEHITRFALDKVKESNSMQSLLATQLLITCMYAGCANKENDSKNGDNPDDLVQTVEKVTAIFDRIKKGLPFEVEILCHILPDVINDFFTPSDILTKVVGEFLSPQQKHPRLLSRVVFQVFESGITQSQLPLLQDWVVVSLSNFTQGFTVGMATWYLTCFFISTSMNFWLRSVFPYLQSRIGRFEQEDKEMLCISGRDFYTNLSTDKQREIFVETFRSVQDQSDMPFRELLENL